MLTQEYVWRLHIEFIMMVSLVCTHEHICEEKEEAKVVMFIDIRIICMSTYVVQRLSGGLCDGNVTGLRPPLATRHNTPICAVG